MTVIKPIIVPPIFKYLISHCYVAVPVDEMGSRPRGYFNGFDHPRVQQRLYRLWKELHSSARKARKADALNWPQLNPDLIWQEQLRIILNGQYMGRREYEWWQADGDDYIRTAGFEMIRTDNDDPRMVRLFRQRPLTLLFGDPICSLSELKSRYDLTKDQYDPIKSLAKWERKNYSDGSCLFAPIEEIMKNPTTDFVPCISPSSEV